MRGTGLPVVVVLLLAALAGCLDSTDPIVDTDAADASPRAAPDNDTAQAPMDAADVPVPAEPFAVPVNGKQCTLQAQVFLVDPDTLDPHLPPGYYPADAGHVLGSPIGLGQGGAAIGTIDCLDSDLGPHRWGVVIIMVIEPTIEGLPSEPETMHMYTPFWTASGDRFIEVMQTLSLDVVPYDIQFAIDLDGADANRELRSVSDIEAAWVDGDSDAFRGRTVSAVPYEFPFSHFRLWTDTPAGTTVLDIDLVEDAEVNDVAFGIGGAVCTMRIGTTAAEVTGTTTCEGNRSVGYSWLHTNVEGKGWLHAPGAHA